jgi:hypothetical protein
MKSTKERHLKKGIAWLLTLVLTVVMSVPAATTAVHAASTLEVTQVDGDNSTQIGVTNSAYKITESGKYTVKGDGTETTVPIIVGEDITVDITLENVNICGTQAIYIGNGTEAVVRLDGDNTLKTTNDNSAGLQSGKTIKQLTICDGNGAGTGSLTATGGRYAAGIGGGYTENGENIVINSGTVTATGGESSGAGIGGGYYGEGKNITINGGTVIATAHMNSAGIGGGTRGAGSAIKITGGTVNATGGELGAGIGGGSNTNGEEYHHRWRNSHRSRRKNRCRYWRWCKRKRQKH